MALPCFLQQATRHLFFTGKGGVGKTTTARSTVAVVSCPPEVVSLLPRLRDPDFTRILLVSLPEATPVQEALSLREDLQRAGIEPFGWVFNQALSGLELSDPVLHGRQAQEAPLLRRVSQEMTRNWLLPWVENPIVEA